MCWGSLRWFYSAGVFVGLMVLKWDSVSVPEFGFGIYIHKNIIK